MCVFAQLPSIFMRLQTGWNQTAAAAAAYYGPSGFNVEQNVAIISVSASRQLLQVFWGLNRLESPQKYENAVLILKVLKVGNVWFWHDSVGDFFNKAYLFLDSLKNESNRK